MAVAEKSGASTAVEVKKRGRPKKHISSSGLSEKQLLVIDYIVRGELSGNPLTQTEIGKLVGVPQSYISKWLKSKKFQEELDNQIELGTMAENLGISIDAQDEKDTGLNRRELIVLEYVFNGETTKSIAEKMNMTVSQVKNIRRKPEFVKQVDRKKQVLREVRGIQGQKILNINLHKLEEVVGSDSMTVEERIKLHKMLSELVGDKQDLPQITFDIKSIEVSGVSYQKGLPPVEE